MTGLAGGAMLAITLGGCFTSQEVDGADSPPGTKLVRSYQLVPGLGDETLYTLRAEGYEPLRVTCSKGEGKIAESPDKSRLAFWCGESKWRVVYKVKGKLLEECPPYAMGSTLNWGAAKDFKAAAPELVRCTRFSNVSQLYRQVATEAELREFFVQSFGMTERIGANKDVVYWDDAWLNELFAASESFQRQVREGLKVRFSRPGSVVDASALTALLSMLGATKETEPLLHSLFLRTVAQEPRAHSLASAMAWVHHKLGDAVATRYACEAMALHSLHAPGLLLLARSQKPCESFDDYVASALNEPSLLCNPHIQCKGTECEVAYRITEPMPHELTQAEWEQVVVLAAVQRKQVPAWFPRAIRRREYVVEMPQSPSCTEAKPGTPCACQVKVCEQVGPTAEQTLVGCTLKFDDKGRRIQVLAP
ncbi:hypothetical protein NVS55_07895 [Myxococcus stipitatus]|uniref:hypothetical protein n=1 Tax=Myxococcus stipitatus TaxID=83455 RepID=UPI0031451433